MHEAHGLLLDGASLLASGRSHGARVMRTTVWIACLLAGVAAASPGSNQEASFRLVLEPGYNAVSVPLEVADNALDELFPWMPEGALCIQWNPITQQFDPPARYVSGMGWRSPTPQAGVLAPGQGALVYVDRPWEVTVVGLTPPAQPRSNLVPGLNLVGCRQLGTCGFVEALGVPPQDGDMIYMFDRPLPEVPVNPADAATTVHRFQAGSWNTVPTLTQGRAAMVYLSPAPRIIRPPEDLMVGLGERAVFSVHVLASPPVWFEWWHNTNRIAGATNPVLVLPKAQLAHAGPYWVWVSNSFGVVTSAIARLRVVTEPLIVQQPVDLTVRAGEPAHFSVQALGAQPLGFQWLFNGMALPTALAAGPTLTVSNAQSAQAGEYRVVVTNQFGSAISAPAFLTVLEPPRITQPPQPTVVAVGEEVVLTVAAEGTGPLRYYWRRNGVFIPDAHEPILRLPAVRPDDSGSYSVVVENLLGAVSSPEVPVWVVLPELNLQDLFTNQVELADPVGVGRASNRGAGVEPGEPLHYGKPGGHSVWLAWRALDDGVVTFRTSGSGFDTLLAAYVGSSVDQLTEVASDDDSAGFLCSQIRFNAVRGRLYHIAIDGFNGQAGDIVLSWTLEIGAEPLPVILQQPQSVLTSLSNRVTFSILATQDVGWSYQWFHNGQPVSLGNEPVLTIQNAQLTDAGVYFVRLIRGAQSLDSRPALLQISLVEPDGPVATNLFADKLADAVRGLSAPAGPAPLPKPPLAAQSLIHGYAGSQVFHTYGAVSEPGEPVHCGVVGGASVWYYYIAPTNGTLHVDTLGSDYDTVLAVYTGPGTEFATLQLVACDNNSGPDGMTSQVNFPATNDTVYFIAVDGVNGATGTLRLNYRLLLSMVLTQQVAAAGTFSFQVHATPNYPFTLQRSHDLTNWISLLTTSTPSGTFTYLESNILSRPKRFYRGLQRP